MSIRKWTLSHRNKTLLRNLPQRQGEPSKFFHVLLPHTVVKALFRYKERAESNKSVRKIKQFYFYNKSCNQC